jgi:hypothetical protein
MKVTNPGAHLDHMLRQTRQYHVQLVSMADFKANILLTVSSVIFTLCIRYLKDPELGVPAVVLIVFCLLTILLSTYTVMPKIPSITNEGETVDLQSSNFNLLFFGDFIKLDFEQYEKAMEDMFNDTSRTYEVQARDLYILGQFLAKKKYRYVRYAYLSFFTGLIASGLAMIFS